MAAEDHVNRIGSSIWTLIALGIAITLSVAAHANSAREDAAEILSLAGVDGGLVIHLGFDDGELTSALCADPSYVVHGLDESAIRVEQAREHIRSLGMYGRVSVDTWAESYLPYSGRLADLVVVEERGKISRKEIMRVLAPRGVACFRTGDDWDIQRKPWPDTLGEWTHFLHGPDGNAVIPDRSIGVPRRIQWSGGPRWSQHHNRVPNVSAMVTARGRLFYIVNDAPPGTKNLPGQWHLRCREAFSGVIQWEIPLGEWGWRAWSDDPVSTSRPGGRFNQPTYLPRTLVAAGERLFVTLGFDSAVSAIDAKSGQRLTTYENTRGADELLVKDGTLIAAVHTADLDRRREAVLEDRRSSDNVQPFGKRIVAVDTESGDLLWHSKEYIGINANRGELGIHRHLSPVAGGGGIYLVTRDALVALDAETGKERWTAPRPKAPKHSTRYDLNANDMTTLVYHGGNVFFAQLEPRERLGWQETNGSVQAYSARNGRKLWSRESASWGWGIEPDLFATNGLVWVWGRGDSPLLGLDPYTGDVVRRQPEFKTFGINHHHRCYRNKATSRFMLTSWRGLECIPWEKSRDGSYTHWWFRAGCRHGFVPSNGLIYNSPDPCVCYLDSKLGGINALAPRRPGPDEHSSVADDARLEKGDAYPAGLEQPKEDEKKWPAYRHDIYRSGYTPAACPANPEKSWSVQLQGEPTPPVIAGGKVFVSSPDSYALRAFEAEQGRRLWSFTAGGRVDTPPTYYRGYLLFGGADGYVYCLRAEDGRLAWKFLAARGTRRVMKEGRLESAWPIHGSIIVQDGRAYVIAGRSTFLDGGIRGWVVGVGSGKILDRDRWNTLGMEPDDEGGTVRARAARPGFASDIPVSDGRSIYMKDRLLFENVLTEKPERPLLVPRSSFLDAKWYNRASQWRLGEELHGESVVASASRVFSFAAYEKIERRSRDGSFIRPGTRAFRLYSKPLSGTSSAEGSSWERNIQVGVTAMVGAGSHLVVSGWPDRVPGDDPWKYIEGRGNGRLLVVSAQDGETVSGLQLPAPPVLDGLASASHRLYVSTQDGHLLCLGERGKK